MALTDYGESQHDLLLVLSCRIDKYYMLVRRFVNATFRLLIRTKWDPAACQEYNNILCHEGGPLWWVCLCSLRFLSL